MDQNITIVGAGLAGCETALYLANRGVEVNLFDMKPQNYSPAHKSPLLSELVCSNSLRSADLSSAVGVLKEEMRLLGSSFMASAEACAIGAGKALAVDRELFSQRVTKAIEQHPLINFNTTEFETLPDQGLVVLATGPLTTESLLNDLMKYMESDGLHFYDAISPIVDYTSLDHDKCFWKDRWSDEPGDYLNCPLTEEEYDIFYNALIKAEQVPLHEFESPRFFEGCLPIEVMASRGYKTLLFGPMKPVGLQHPQTGEKAFAVVQLRKENSTGTSLNIVGFQTKLTYKSQKKVLSLIPALSNAEFVRYGSIHRNTFIEAPKYLDCFLRLKKNQNLLLAGQISGVEGYVESAATGLLAGINVLRIIQGKNPLTPPATTSMGALITHLTNRHTPDFQPSNVNFGLFPSLMKKHSKKDRKRLYGVRALEDMKKWISLNHLT